LQYLYISDKPGIYGLEVTLVGCFEFCYDAKV